MKTLIFTIGIKLFIVITICNPTLSWAQKKDALYLKTNLTNILFKSPTLAVEKHFKNKAIEFSIVSGKAESFLHYTDYKFTGLLFRYTKREKTFLPNTHFFYGPYLGYLYRDYAVDFTKYYNNTYTGGTVRGGISSGYAVYPLKGKMVIDFQTSIGYGRNLAPHEELKQYLDLQVWLSVGLRLN